MTTKLVSIQYFVYTTHSSYISSSPNTGLITSTLHRQHLATVICEKGAVTQPLAIWTDRDCGNLITWQSNTNTSRFGRVDVTITPRSCRKTKKWNYDCVNWLLASTCSSVFLYFRRSTFEIVERFWLNWLQFEKIKLHGHIHWLTRSIAYTIMFSSTRSKQGCPLIYC